MISTMLQWGRDQLIAEFSADNALVFPFESGFNGAAIS